MSTPIPSAEQSAAQLLELVRRLGGELKIRPSRLQALQLDSHFDRDLGLDSLTRMELLARVEAGFGVRLAEAVYANVETPRDLLRAVLAAHSAGTGQAVEVSHVRLEHTQSAPDDARTLLEVLDWHAERHPDRPHIQCYQDEGDGEAITYGQLRRRAEAVAAGLQRQGLRPRQAVAIMLPTSPEYFYAFFGALLAGGVPVPIYPPARPSHLEDHLLRHRAILDNCQAAVLVTLPEAIKVARLLKSHVASLGVIATVDELAQSGGSLVRHKVEAGDIAFLQYTSGSTGTPKGVMLTHANLLANVRAMGEATGADSSDVFVSWLPLYHDMGLIGAWLGSLYHAMLMVNFSPLAFLARPSRWLWAIHRYGGTLTAAPNFAYELCLKRLKDESLQGLDLSRLRLMFNGAEPVNPDTLERFCEYFGRFGFSRTAMTPVYGLAENSVGLSFPPLRRGPLFDCVDRGALASSGRAVPSPAGGRGGEGGGDTIRFPACGMALPGHEIRIVDAAGREVPEREQGSLEFRGPSATSGYYRNPEATRALFRDGWIKSGDLAYMAGGEVYITGRVKDVIIHAGRNIYPHELEGAVGQLPGIRAGCVAVFGCSDAASGTEKLVVMAESRESEPDAREALCLQVNEAAVELVGMPPDEVVLVPPHTVLKTSSGKIRRAACRELYESGLALAGPRSAKAQMLRLMLAAGLPQLSRWLRQLGAATFAAYAWLVLLFAALSGWLAVVLCPLARWRWPLLRLAAKAVVGLTATPVSVRGLENLPPQGRPAIYVCNHASYLDGLALACAMPRPLAFVAKVELSKQWLAGLFLRRIGTEFVERFDRQQGLGDARRLAESARQGRSLLYFPEGTFTRAAGLLPFRMGAFQAAAQGGLPVVPVAIKGTRDMLRDGTWFPRRGTLTVTVGESIDTPALREREGLADEWQLALRLRDLSREQVLRHCGEPDTGQEG
ncbi:AMP-binding protein [Methylogaea oryzae]|uniref:Acyl-CoA synthetase n=2 Tax=Methylogaea oryzae TaxID=1295382 RepID=A0A8D5AJ64_9GAMM|nr:AMP-binding protein [Methylogaea oryzae]BBL70454.1 acyl-CoA synthetase [Methylogaea oryzae]